MATKTRKRIDPEKDVADIAFEAEAKFFSAVMDAFIASKDGSAAIWKLAITPEVDAQAEAVGLAAGRKAWKQWYENEYSGDPRTFKSQYHPTRRPVDAYAALEDELKK